MITNKFSKQQNNIIRTAFLTAYPKIFTDIDYSMEIFSYMKNLVIKNGFSFEPDQFTNAMALEIEARHKAINHELDRLIDHDTLVIEIAAGLSPRHLQYQSYDYIELDFKPVIEIKKSIYSDLSYERLNNTLFDVDLANIEQLHRCLITILKHNQHKKIVVISEGLFWYLTKDVIGNLAREFTTMFQGYDWYWISADCPCDDIQDYDHRKTIADSAKVKRGTFTDFADFKNFFAIYGLVTQRYQLADLLKHEDLFSANFFSINQPETIKRINSYTDIAVLKNSPQ